MHPLSLVFVVIVLLCLALRLWLAWRQMDSIRRHRAAVPPAFADVIDAGTHRRSADYSVARTRLQAIDTTLEMALLLAWTVGGGLALLDQAWRALELGPIVTGLGVLASVVLVGALVDLPLRVYKTFVVEQRFGFNRTTATLFALDQVRAAMLLLALGLPLAGAILWLMHAGGAWWWLYAWAVWLAFNLFVIWAWPAVIAPLFNRFEPLADNGLQTRIERLLSRCGFASGGVYVMDGSRRSGHANAYFSGLGRNKRIVFYDTLLEQLDADEIEAVLAHELGHFRHRHIAKRVAVMAAASLIGLAALAWLAEQSLFYTALGVSQPSMHIALALFLLCLPVVTFFLQPLLAWVSRRHEFEADAFAARHCRSDHLVAALIDLYRENANTLTPDPIWSAFYDSHPPALQRIAHLQAGKSQAV